MAKKTQAESQEARIARICGNINGSAFGGDNHDAVTFMGSRDIIQVPRWSSGCPDLDDALGGGWPKGRFSEIFGPESGGKTTLALHGIAEHQKAFPDEDVGLIDAEFSFDEAYASALGVDMRYVIVHQPDSGEQALNILKLMLQSSVRLVVVDSVAALTTRAELEGDIGDIHVAQQARLMSQALKTLVAEGGKRESSVLWTNQIRDKIGVTFGERTTTPAGRALPFYASVRVNVVRIGTVREGPKDNQTAVSNKTRADVKKNKTAPPFRRAEFPITYGIGIDLVAAVFDGAVIRNVVTKRGSWFSFDGEQLGQGRPAALELLRENDDLFKKVADALQAAKDVEAPKAPIKRPKAASAGASDEDSLDGAAPVDAKVVEVTDA